MSDTRAVPAPSAEETFRIRVPLEDEEPPKRRFLFSWWHLVLLPLAFVMILPLIWMIVTSFETLNETRTFPPVLLPHSLQWSNYGEVLRQAPFAQWFTNTLLVTTATVAGNLLLCSLAGYAFARIKFFGREVVFLLVLATLMVPLQVVIIPTFLIVKRLGLIDTLGALIVPNLTEAFGIFMLRQFFRTLPIELEEAARIDGASRFQAMVRIVLPLCTPGLLSAGIFAFTLAQNEFLYALIFLAKSEVRTVPVGAITELIRGDVFYWGQLMAAALLGSVPVAIIYSFFVEYYVAGLTAGSVKG
jgi:multiple sugar transport system permease protein